MKLIFNETNLLKYDDELNETYLCRSLTLHPPISSKPIQLTTCFLCFYSSIILETYNSKAIELTESMYTRRSGFISSNAAISRNLCGGGLVVKWSDSDTTRPTPRKLSACIALLCGCGTSLYIILSYSSVLQHSTTQTPLETLQSQNTLEMPLL